MGTKTYERTSAEEATGRHRVCVFLSQVYSDPVNLSSDFKTVVDQ
jgi:hypothetical protein